jgi:hypothetical protein
LASCYNNLLLFEFFIKLAEKFLYVNRNSYIGLGLPRVAAYALTSALTAPTIQKLAVINGIPQEAALLATHMFLFYYCLSVRPSPGNDAGSSGLRADGFARQVNGLKCKGNPRQAAFSGRQTKQPLGPK